RQCFSCDASTCSKTLACEGKEDYSTLKGCVSELICSASNSFISQLPGGKISCCKGNFCNSAVTASAGPQLVAVVMISMALFS
uniref:UPAR/Ly6 domain-containing protein n=1 Tax=Oryzias sinensis TaxID=183150 RepID=A0A8C7X6P7_9TELE